MRRMTREGGAEAQTAPHETGGFGAGRPSSLGTAALVLLATLVAALPLSAQDARPSFYEPGISPDGREIAFVHGGDIWTVPTGGGQARLLVAHEEEESRPLYSPDGRWLAFGSSRDGTNHIYLLDLASGETRQLTFMSTSTLLDGWSADSEWVWFSSVSDDVAGMSDVFRVRVSGGTPMPVLADRYAAEFWASPHPDGRVALSVRGRTAWSQWWRNGHSHMDEAEIWIADPGGDRPTYRPVTAGGKNGWPMWAPDGDLVFMSDRSGSENLWRVSETGGQPTRLTDFDEGRVLWPSISGTGVVAFERDFRIWTHDLASGRTAPVEIRAVGAVQGPRVEPETATAFSGFTVSPDGEKLVVVARGELFAGAATEGDAGSITTRVTDTPAPEGSVRWAHDSRHVVYTSARDGSSDLYLFDFGEREERALTSGDGLDQAPSWAPDDLRIAYVRDGSELRVLDVESGDDEIVATGLIGFGSTRVFGAPTWSPDGRWLAYMASPDGEFWNVHVVPADGSAEPRAVSFLPNTFGGTVAWHPDGRSIFYTTSQRTEDTRVIRVDLVPRTPVFREDALDELFRIHETPSGAAADAGDEASEADADEPDEVRIDFDDIRRRYEIVPVPFSVNEMAVSPDGKTLVVSGSAAGRQNLYALALDPLDDEDGVRPLTDGPGFKGGIEFAEAPDRVWYIQGGRVRSVGLDGNGDRTVSLAAEMEIDFDAEKGDVFLANWSTLDQGFYDPDHHGADWNAVREHWAPVVAGSLNRQEMRRALVLMTGELNASHTGVGGSESPSTPQVGRLGLRFDRRAYEDRGRLVVSEVLELGPAHVSGEISVGDRLVSVDGVELGADTNLNRVLRGTVDERVRLGVASAGSDEVRTVALKPISLGGEKNLVYRAWVESRRAYVAEVSGGRLGYVHIPDMGAGTLQQLYLDLDQENRDREGVVVDVRNNNGGFVNAYALDVFTRRSFMTMQPRGGAEASSRHQLGQRAYLDPVILVTNQNTLSDGEDFTEGWRALGIGEVVGEPTAGWIIYTTNLSLFDGTSMRLPFIGIRGADGEDMELHPRPVDVEVERPAGEWYTGSDVQLDRAVERLLARIDGGG